MDCTQKRAKVQGIDSDGNLVRERPAPPPYVKGKWLNTIHAGIFAIRRLANLNKKTIKVD